MKRVGLFINVHDTYFRVFRKYRQHLNYQTLLDFCEGVALKNAYGYYTSGAEKFVTYLKALEFDVKYKTPSRIPKTDNLDGLMTLDMLLQRDNIDRYIMVTSSHNLFPVYDYLRELDKQIVVLTCKVYKQLRNHVDDAIEIPESFLETKETSSETSSETNNNLSETNNETSSDER